MDFTNREIATLIWFGAIIAAIFIAPKIRGSALAVLRALSQRIFVIVFSIAGLYVAACVALLAKSGIWTPNHLKTTLWWVATVGFVSMFHINRIDEDRTYFQKALRDILGFAPAFIFLIESYSFPLLVEIFFVPLMAFLGMMLAFADRPEHAPAKTFLTNLTALIGISLLGYALYQTARHWVEFATVETLREFLIPFQLSLMFLPFLYVMSVYTVYERVLASLRWSVKDDRLRRYAKWRAILHFRFNLDLLKRWHRLIGLERPEDREALRASIREVMLLYAREKNPPDVSPAEGWSPYAAMAFLAKEGIESGDYHRIYDRWQSSSKFLKLDQKALSNSIVYYVEGSELVADELTLELMVNHIELREDADARFLSICQLLMRKALGDDAAALLPPSLQNLSIEFKRSRVRLETEEWTINKFSSYQRTLTILHPRHARS